MLKSNEQNIISYIENKSTALNIVADHKIPDVMKQLVKY